MLTSALPSSPLNLEQFDEFSSHQWVTDLSTYYERNSALAKSTVNRLILDLEYLNKNHHQENGRVLFTSIDGRVKSRDSWLQKIFDRCRHDAKTNGATRESILNQASKIDDLAGVRFACPYFDEVAEFANDRIRPFLTKLGYATELSGDEFADKDLLDKGDEYGYRSYHFYVRVPTIINIFDDVELFLCELQGRSELQHIWAVKSHDLLYKPKIPMAIKKRAGLLEDMRHIGNNLRSVDHHLVRIRQGARGV